jgi:hypothetical protein
MGTITVYKGELEAVIDEENKKEWADKGWVSKEPKRARNDDGTLKSDDKSTKDVNEAWEGGKAPKAKK